MNKQLRLVLSVAILASFVTFLDGAIVNVALPAIQRELGGGLSAQQWIVDAYLLTLGSFILIAGSLSDLLGRKRILKFGLWGFAVTSLMCALSPNSQLLIISRALQGIAGALLVPSSLALIISAFKGPAQGKAVGRWTAWTGMAFLFGPLLGGVLIDQASWRWIFAINILPIAVTLYLLQRLETVKDDRGRARVDLIGAGLCALGLAGPVFALIEQPRYGWGDPRIYVSLVAGILIFITFLLYERRAKQPMLPLHLFINRNFSVGNLATVMIYSGLSISTFLIVVYLQQAGGYTALQAGLALLPVTLIMFFLSPRIGGLSAKYGPRLFMGIGPLIAAIGFLLMLRIGSDINYPIDVLPAVIVFGLGLSTTVAPLTAAILSDVSDKQAGIASAVNNAIARVAGLVAIALIGAVVAAQYATHMDNDPNLGAGITPALIQKAKQSPFSIVRDQKAMDDLVYDSAIFEDVQKAASVSAFHAGVLVTAALVASGGLISLMGIRNPR